MTTPEQVVAGDLIVRDVAVLDGTGREPEGRLDVVVRGGPLADPASIPLVLLGGVVVKDSQGRVERAAR